ncbi:N-6 DNA methylase [Burkholderia metallica]
MNIAFATKLPADLQKLRGGYYTPAAVVAFLVDWAIRSGDDTVLEPSCGDGNFLVGIAKKFRSLRAGQGGFTAVEVEPNEFAKARQRIAGEKFAAEKADWINGDFFQSYSALKAIGFDVILGNPPFIRFQHFREESRDVAFSHLRDAGYRPTKLANAWAAFVQLSIELLKTGGRLAMVVPAELLQVQYAAELRERIASHFTHVVLVSFKRLIFPEIQQEVVLLLAEGKREERGDHCDIHTVDVDDESELEASALTDVISHTAAKHTRPGMKWTSLHLSADAFDAIDRAERLEGLTRMSELASTEVGVVTGLNSFFVLPKARAEALEAINFTVPTVGKTSSLSGLKFDPVDYREHASKWNAFLLNFNGISSHRIPKPLLDYIAHAESEGIHQGYKCSIRKRWYDVPSIYVPDGFLFRQIHEYPLLVVNEANATSTDTIHRVRVREGVDIRRLAVCFFNSLTLAWAEVAGRSYGGGVLELEPREAASLPIPYFEDAALDFDYVDKLIRAKKISAALDYVDGVLLVGVLGLSKRSVRSIRSAWEQLRDRRIGRR